MKATDFHSRKIPEEGSNFINSVLKNYENYYLQVFLKECKNIKTERLVSRYIADDLKYSSDDSSESNEE